MTITKILEKFASKIHFENLSYLVFKKAKTSKGGDVISGEQKVMLENTADIIIYFLLVNSQATTDKTLEQLFDYTFNINIAYKDTVDIENIIACLNEVLYNLNIFVTNTNYESDRNLKSDWAINDDRYPYNYSAISITAKIENLLLENCKNC